MYVEVSDENAYLCIYLKPTFINCKTNPVIYSVLLTFTYSVSLALYISGPQHSKVIHNSAYR